MPTDNNHESFEVPPTGSGKKNDRKWKAKNRGERRGARPERMEAGGSGTVLTDALGPTTDPFAATATNGAKTILRLRGEALAPPPRRRFCPLPYL